MSVVCRHVASFAVFICPCVVNIFRKDDGMYIEMAERLAREHHTRNPLEIAKNMNISVLYLPFDEMYGMACSLGEYRLIGVNTGLGEPVQRLVIAHELGHFVLHPEGNFFFVLNQTMFYSKLEYQANMFAIGLCIGEEVARYDFVKEIASGKIENLCKIL
jgi:Zn-dependent peptidase ImmA (M78 family)